MSDPRIERTRVHVLSVARDMLTEGSGEALTFSSLSERARVSRRTLYTHWGTVEQLIADAVNVEHAEIVETDPAGLSPRERLSTHLRAIRDGLAQPLTRVALATLIGQAPVDAKAAESLAAMNASRLQHFREFVGPVTQDHYNQLVGPIFLAEFVVGVPASDEEVRTLAEHGATLLELGD